MNPYVDVYVVVVSTLLSFTTRYGVYNYFKDMQQLSCVGIPNFQEMVVNSSDDCIVMAIPCYHGDFGFQVAFLFPYWFSTDKEKNTENMYFILQYMYSLSVIVQCKCK